MRFAILPLFAVSITFAPVDSARAQAADGPVMEVVTFHLTPGVTDAAFLAAAKATQDTVAAQSGFVRRSLLRDGEGLWTDAVEWQNLSAARVAAETLIADPSFAPFGGAIDMSTLRMRHIPILWQMGD